jgi:replication factor A1
MSEIHILGKILDISNLRTFKRKDGSNGNVRNMTIGDATGKIRVTLWDELANTIDTFVVGDAIEIFGGYAKENTFNNQVEVNLGNNSSLRKSSKQVEFKEVITQITDIEIKESYNIVGNVTGLDELKEFQKKDGSTGRVVNIHISDNSGRIKVSLWGEQTDILREIDLGTKLQINDCYAKPGWNDEIELSVGERARIIILEK